MVRISLQTLRSRRGSLAGRVPRDPARRHLRVRQRAAHGGRAARRPAPGRLAAADLVVRADPTVQLGADDERGRHPGPAAARRTSSRTAAAVDGVARAIGDTTFPVGACDRRRQARHGRRRPPPGHAWSAAAAHPLHARGGPRAARRRRGRRRHRRRARRVGDELTVAAAGGEARVARRRHRPRSAATRDGGQAAVFFAAGGRRVGCPARPGAVTAIGDPAPRPARRSHDAARAACATQLGPDVEVLDRDHAAYADAGDPRERGRASLVAIFGTMGGIAGAVALFVVSGTFALAIAQRRKETAVLRALGASPAPGAPADRRGGPDRLARRGRRSASRSAARWRTLIVSLLEDHGTIAGGFALGAALDPRRRPRSGSASALAQLAVIAAARRAGRTRPAEALREVADRARPARRPRRSSCGLACLGGGVAMALRLRRRTGRARSRSSPGCCSRWAPALLGRLLLGVPAALLAAAAAAARRRRACSPATSLAANRWRTAALATPIVLDRDDGRDAGHRRRDRPATTSRRSPPRA